MRNSRDSLRHYRAWCEGHIEDDVGSGEDDGSLSRILEIDREKRRNSVDYASPARAQFDRPLDSSMSARHFVDTHNRRAHTHTNIYIYSERERLWMTYSLAEAVYSKIGDPSALYHNLRSYA